MRDANDHGSSRPSDDIVGFARLVWFAAACLAYPHELIVRRQGTMGREYPSAAAGTVGLLILPWAFAAVVPPHYGTEWIFPHWLLLLACALAHRAARVRRGHIHRHAMGDPLFPLGRMPYAAEYFLGLGLTLGGFLLSDTIGMLHLASLLGSQINIALVRDRDQRVVDRMRDAELEARYYTDRFRGQ